MGLAVGLGNGHRHQIVHRDIKPESNLIARLGEWERAAATVAALFRLLPLSGSLLQARWSGEAARMPLGSVDVGAGAENDTQRPAPGQVLLHPHGISETEILIPYGEAAFASEAGPLCGDHVMTIVEGAGQLAELAGGWCGKVCRPSASKS